MRHLYLTLILLFVLCCCVQTAFGEEDVKEKQAEQAPATSQETTPPARADVKGKGPSVSTRQREPFAIAPELEAQREEVEPPEIKVTSVMQIKGKAMALVELQLEDYDGTAMLEPGMRVSMPKPNTGESESKKWMTYFTVSRISKRGMVIVLENGEVVWYPVVGELD